MIYKYSYQLSPDGPINCITVVTLYVAIVCQFYMYAFDNVN